MPLAARLAILSFAFCHAAVAQCGTAEWNVINAPNAPSPRWSAYGWYSPPNQGLVVFGGWCCGRDDMWLWNGTAWAQLNPSPRPAGRLRGAMAWDAGRNVGVIHGGIGAPPYPILSDTWEWNGSQWTLRPAQGPVLHDHAMAYDEARGRLVLYGGRNAAGVWQNGTWEYDGSTTWELRSNTPSIPPSVAASMTFDRTRGTLIAVPFTQTATAIPTFEWTGSTWTAVATPLPPYEYATAAWTDPVSGSASFLVYGPPSGGGESSDVVYRLVGSGWQTKVVSSTHRRFGAVSGLNPATNKLLVFGGANANNTAAPNNVLELTAGWVDGESPAIVNQPQSQALVPGAVAIFAVDATGTGLSYQWRRNGSPLVSDGRIGGTTSPTLTIDSIGPGDQGSYDCVITGTCGTATSSAASLGCTPIFTQQPQGGAFIGGSTITLTTTVATAGTTTYRWRRNGINIFNSQTYSGVSTPTLTIVARDPNDSATYTLVVTNACGTEISEPAVVDVSCLSDFNLDGGVDGEDLFSFFGVWEQGQSEADVNQDGGVDFGDVEGFFERWEAGC